LERLEETMLPASGEILVWVIQGIDASRPDTGMLTCSRLDPRFFTPTGTNEPVAGWIAECRDG